MREKKEFHRNNLPHFQQPGQAYFVTWNLNTYLFSFYLCLFPERSEQVVILFIR